MRERKCRVFVKTPTRKEGEMVYLDNAGLQYFDFEGNYALSFVVDGYSGFYGHENYNVKLDYIFMDYIGIPDCDGTPIYEDDIVSRDFASSFHPLPDEFIVAWSNDTLGYMGVNTKDPTHTINLVEWDLKVVGNKHTGYIK